MNKKLDYPSHTMRNTIQVWHTTIIEDQECDIEYTFDYIPECKGSTDYYGQQMEPDSPSALLFVSAVDSEGNEVEVVAEDIEAAESLANDSVESEDW